MKDALADLNPKQLAAWYGRLADMTAERKWGGTEELASRCLRLWLENRAPYTTITFEAPPQLLTSPYVVKALKYHRRVYLTEEKARLSTGIKWAGIIPRLQGKGYPQAKRWTGIKMNYESLVDMPITAKIFGSGEDKDLLYALHGLQLKTEVTVSCSMMAGSNLVRVVFVSFEAKLKNRYEWNPDRQITVPNPDYKSRRAGAVEPNAKTITVNNAHARRLEEAGLAAPYYVESETWYVDSSLCGQAQVDRSKKI